MYPYGLVGTWRKLETCLHVILSLPSIVAHPATIGTSRVGCDATIAIKNRPLAIDTLRFHDAE
jgi:hypothetical protein